MSKQKKTNHRRKSKKKLIRKRKALKPIDFKRELAAGIKVELEHTKHIRSKAKARKVAERIARDHLRETPSYYRRLKKCFPHEHHNNPGRPGKSCMTAQLRMPGRNPISADDMEAMNRLAAKMQETAKRAGRTNTDTADLTPSERAQYRRLRGKFGAALVLESPRFHEGMGGSPSYNPRRKHKSWTKWPVVDGRQVPSRCAKCGKVASHYHGGQWVCPKHGPKLAHNPKSMKNYIVREMMPDWKRKIDPRSIRTKTIYTKKGGKRLLRIGCPKGEWLARQQRCKSGTKAISMLTPKSEKILSLHGKAAAHRAAGNPDNSASYSVHVLAKGEAGKKWTRWVQVLAGSEHEARRIVLERYGRDARVDDIVRDRPQPHRSATNPTKKFWRDMSVKTAGLLSECHATYTGRRARALTSDEYRRFRETSERIGSNLKQLADSEEQIERDPRFKHLLRLGHTFGNPGGKLTIAEAKRQMPSGFVLSKDQSGDYIVKRRGSPESQWYFTGDLRDAVGTARDMAHRAESQSRSRIVPRRMNPHDERSRMASPSFAGRSNPAGAVTSEIRGVARRVAHIGSGKDWDGWIMDAIGEYGKWDLANLKNEYDKLVKELNRVNPKGGLAWGIATQMLLVIELRKRSLI